MRRWMSSKTSEIGFKSARRELIILVSMLLFSFSLLGCERGANKVPSAPATDSGASSSPTSRTATAVILPPPNPAHGFSHSHIFVIVMENLGYSQALATPAISALAKRWAYESQYYAITHPSLPNYLSLIGGSTFSITSDCVDCFVSAPSLASEMSQKEISWSA